MKITLSLLMLLFILASCSYSTKNEGQKPEFNPIILDKFTRIYNTLDTEFKKTMYFNNQLIEKIENSKDTIIINKAKELRKQTSFIIKILGFAKTFVYYNIGGGIDDKKYTLKNPMETIKVEHYFLYQNKKGEAYNIAEKIQDYYQYLNREFSDFIPKEGLQSIVEKSKANPLILTKSHLRKADFAHLYFQESSAIVALTTIMQLQMELFTIESDLLIKLQANLKH